MIDSGRLSSDAALQLVNRLKQGRNVIFGANLFSVGREELLAGAEQVFEDIERTGDSVVRFIRGDYGVGKTNFCARLFLSALRRGWVSAYLELSEEIKLYEFHHIFAEIVKKMYVPEQVSNDGSDIMKPVGLIGVLDRHYQKMRRAIGLGAGADISASAKSDLIGRVNASLQKERVYGDFAAAVRTYFECRLDDDAGTLKLLERWFLADQDIRIPSRGVMRPITKIHGKEYLRALSSLLAGMGYRGMLVIIDELEGIMSESRTRRRRAYTILRELMDNVDGENGMRQTCLYAAAPPGQFEAQKGFIEVEALSSRIQSPLLTLDGPPDCTATIVDLDHSPLTRKQQVDLGRRLRELHGIARSWRAIEFVPESKLLQLVDDIHQQRPYSNLRVREFCIEMVSALDRLYSSSDGKNRH
jgi:hypothetical protein